MRQTRPPPPKPILAAFAEVGDASTPAADTEQASGQGNAQVTVKAPDFAAQAQKEQQQQWWQQQQRRQRRDMQVMYVASLCMAREMSRLTHAACGAVSMLSDALKKYALKADGKAPPPEKPQEQREEADADNDDEDEENVLLWNSKRDSNETHMATVHVPNPSSSASTRTKATKVKPLHKKGGLRSRLLWLPHKRRNASHGRVQSWRESQRAISRVRSALRRLIRAYQRARTLRLAGLGGTPVSMCASVGAVGEHAFVSSLGTLCDVLTRLTLSVRSFDHKEY